MTSPQHDTKMPLGVPPLGTVVDGKYELVRLLGVGGMGVVVAARHVKLGQPFALKFLLGEQTRQPEALARFQREGRAAATLRSEHVARVNDIGALETGEPYLVMEFLHGGDLNALVEREGRLAPERAVDYVLQALEALAEAHAAGIIHRDLKPANLFLTSRVDGSALVKILDFGISKLVSDTERITASSAVMGSPHYMSPEQIKSVKNVDARTDVWAVGVILYELVTGKLPFDADSIPGIVAAIVTEHATPPTVYVPGLPRELEAVILACLEKDRNRRVRDVAELAERLAPFASGAGRGDVDRIRRIAQSGALRAATLNSVEGMSTPPAIGTDSSWQQTSRQFKAKGSGATTAIVVALAAVVLVAVGLGFAVRKVVSETVATESSVSRPVAAAAPSPAATPQPFVDDTPTSPILTPSALVDVAAATGSAPPKRPLPVHAASRVQPSAAKSAAPAPPAPPAASAPPPPRPKSVDPMAEP